MAGIDDRFDHIFNTSEVGVAKPSPEIYAHVVAQLGFAPNEIFFTDDSQRNVDAARVAGWHAHHFTGRATLCTALVDAGFALA